MVSNFLDLGLCLDFGFGFSITILTDFSLFVSGVGSRLLDYYVDYYGDYLGEFLIRMYSYYLTVIFSAAAGDFITFGATLSFFLNYSFLTYSFFFLFL